MKKVFFGGSFDPPHNGHLGIAQAALASGRCSEVIWFPAYIPPHKITAMRASFADRIAMIKLLIKDEKRMSVSDFEAQIKLNPSYTINVLARLKEETGDDYALLIGADSLQNLHLWHQADKLVDTVELICYPRNNANVSKEHLLQYWKPETVEKLLKSIIPGTFFEISSTGIKNSMEKSSLKHHIIQPELLPPEIAGYIRDNGLYLNNNAYRKG